MTNRPWNNSWIKVRANCLKNWNLLLDRRHRNDLLRIGYLSPLSSIDEVFRTSAGSLICKCLFTVSVRHFGFAACWLPSRPAVVSFQSFQSHSCTPFLNAWQKSCFFLLLWTQRNVTMKKSFYPSGNEWILTTQIDSMWEFFKAVRRLLVV